MKKLFLVIVAAVAVINISFSSFATEDQPVAKVFAYYFHGTFRCNTCTKMEEYSREAIEANFQDALVSGNLEFKAVNVEDSGNEHFVNDYQLYTKSLILSFVRNGKEVRHKNLDKIWEHSLNRQKFIDYVAAEISGFLKDAQ
ncbi:MAG: nitrophenyl compound nitroreductase subunit ArsF family protein [Candidatus Omnitrophica bacterium]|nr:nitrophenyl compound nitroreductase subunit ArsF family protein [Candidatus Omnitrophota bacterium]